MMVMGQHQQSYNNRSDDDESGESDDSDLDRLVGGGLDEIDEERFDKYFDELEKFQTTYKPVESYNESFNLWKDYSVPIAKYMKSNMDGIQNINDNIPLYPGSKNTMKQCAVNLRNIASKHKLSVDAELDMLVFLKELLPNTANLPLHQTKNGMYKSDMDTCLSQENIMRGVIDFDICPNGCTVFVGDESLKQECSSCTENRYTTCKQCTRLNNGNFIINDVCQHNSRIALKQITYRCILPIIISLIVNPTFIQLINFKHYNYLNGDVVSNDYICDVGDSVAYKEAMNEMMAYFDQSKVEKSTINGVVIDSSTIHVPLLFSIFYDGVQLFKTKQYSYHPLFLTILNLPPIFRSIVGLG